MFSKDGELERIDLLPCTLGRSGPRSRRGTPRLASDDATDEILTHLQSLSDRFGTDIERTEGYGVIRPS